MNDNNTVKKMIDFIEEKERQIQMAKFSNESQIKNDVVKAILDELEKEVSNENK